MAKITKKATTRYSEFAPSWVTMTPDKKYICAHGVSLQKL